VFDPTFCISITRIDSEPRPALLSIPAGFVALKAAVKAGQFLAQTARGGVLATLSFSLKSVGAGLRRLTPNNKLCSAWCATFCLPWQRK
jgi:hypothetical protein